MLKIPNTSDHRGRAASTEEVPRNRNILLTLRSEEISCFFNGLRNFLDFLKEFDSDSRGEDKELRHFFL